jgi:hypothetical protein
MDVGFKIFKSYTKIRIYSRKFKFLTIALFILIIFFIELILQICIFGE